MIESQRPPTESFELSLLQRLRELLNEGRQAPRETLERCLEEVARCCRADRVVLATLRNDDQAHIDVSVGLTREQARRGWYRLGQGVIGRVIESGAPIAAEPKPSDRGDYGGTWPLPESNISRYLCVPVITRARGVIGALGVDRERTDAAWMQDELRLLNVIASVISDVTSALRTVQEEEEDRDRESKRWDELTRDACSPAIIGSSQSTHHLLGLIRRVAPSDCTVLICGESGAGKELVAKEIHALSARADQPMVSINCGAIVGPLAESELFGHVKGAYTGASGSRRGVFGLADGGTLFLDEVSEMPLLLQVKLLRALQEQEIHRLGEEKPRSINVRVIAATNVDLAAAVRDGSFREDLYYRLNAFPIAVPPLRERQSDIAVLARHFCVEHSKKHNREPREISSAAMAALVEHSWPGNIRELENVMLRALLLARGVQIELGDLPIDVSSRGRAVRTDAEGLKERLSDFERTTILRAMREAGGSQIKAARALQTTPRILAYRLRRLGIEAAQQSSTAHELRD